MVKRIAGCALVGLAALASGGCGWFGGGQPSGGVAVVDLDEIASQVGAGDEIAQALKSREVALNAQLKSMKTSYVQQFQERKALYGDEPTKDQNIQLVSIGRQINTNLATAKRQAANDLSNQRSQLIKKFRAQVSPIAEEVAGGRGLSLVVPKNEGWLLYADEAIDITDEVAAKLKDNWQPIAAEALATPQPRVAANPAAPAGNQPTYNVQPAEYEAPVPSGQ